MNRPNNKEDEDRVNTATNMAVKKLKIGLVRVLFSDSRREAPLELFTIASLLIKNGYEVIIHDIFEHQIDWSAGVMIKEDIDILGVAGTFAVFSAINLRYCNILKSRKTNILTVWGGVNSRSEIELHLKESCIDVVALGEENVMLDICHFLEGRIHKKEVRGISYLGANGNIEYSQEVSFENDLDNIPLYIDQFDFSPYVFDSDKETQFFSYKTSRGCPFSCSFCFISAAKYPPGIKSYRVYSEDRVVKDILRLKQQYGFDRIRLMDENFFVNKERSFNIIDRLFEKGVKLSSLDIRCPDVTHELMEYLQARDVDILFVGSESPDDKILKRINKRITLNQIENAFRTVASYPRVTVQSQVIVGFPFHTDRDVRHAIEKALEWNSMYPNVFISITPYVPYRGTLMYCKTLEQNGIRLWHRLEDLASLYAPYYEQICFPIFWTACSKKFESFLSIIRPIANSLLDAKKISQKPNIFVKAIGLFFFNLAKFRLENQIPILWRIDKCIMQSRFPYHFYNILRNSAVFCKEILEKVFQSFAKFNNY